MNRDTKLVTNIIIILLSVVLIISILITTVRIISDNSYYTYDTDSFVYALRSQHYSEMVDYKYRNESLGLKADSELQELYHVATYYETAFFYRAAMESGDTETADQCKEVMDTEAAGFGPYSYAVEEINTVLGI